MELINNLEKTEVILVGGVILLGIVAFGGFLTYETITNFDEVKQDAKIGEDILVAASGEPIIEHVIIPVGKEVEEAFTEPFKTTEDIFKYGPEEAADKYLERQTQYASEWLQILGSDIYNDGFLSQRYTALRENGEGLAKDFKKSPFQYFKELAPGIREPFVWKVPYDDTPLHVISPFRIRQNLDTTPFAGHLRGLAGTNATSLKHFIWTDYDKVPEYLKNWNKLSESDKNKIKELIKKDRQLAEAMLEKKTYNYWIVKDRVLNYNNLLKYYLINI